MLQAAVSTDTASVRLARNAGQEAMKVAVRSACRTCQRVDLGSAPPDRCRSPYCILAGGARLALLGNYGGQQVVLLTQEVIFVKLRASGRKGEQFVSEVCRGTPRRATNTPG